MIANMLKGSAKLCTAPALPRRQAAKHSDFRDLFLPSPGD